MVRVRFPPAASPLRTDFPAGSKGRTQRKTDSNHRFPRARQIERRSLETKALSPRGTTSSNVSLRTFGSGGELPPRDDIVLDAFLGQATVAKRQPTGGGLRVRIQFPPARSLRTIGSARGFQL